MVTFVLFAFLLSYGCVISDTNERFYPSGHSSAVQQIRISSMVNILEQSKIDPPDYYLENGGWSQYFNELCFNASIEIFNVNCHRSGDWLILDIERISGPDYVLTSYDAFPYTVHDLTIFKPPVPPLPDLAGVSVYRFPKNLTFHSGNDSELIKLESSGLQYKYLVIMPGEIIEYNAGIIVPDGLMIDALAQAALAEPVRIKTRSLNTTQVTVLVFGGLLLFLIFDLCAILVSNEWVRRRRAAYTRVMRGGTAKQQEDAVFKRDKLKNVYDPAGGRVVYSAKKKRK